MPMPPNLVMLRLLGPGDGTFDGKYLSDYRHECVNDFEL